MSRQSGRVAIRRSQQDAGVDGALLEGTEPLPIVESVPLRLLDHLHHDRPCTVELAGFAADPDLVSECPNVVVGVEGEPELLGPPHRLGQPRLGTGEVALQHTVDGQVDIRPRHRVGGNGPQLIYPVLRGLLGRGLLEMAASDCEFAAKKRHHPRARRESRGQARAVPRRRRAAAPPPAVPPGEG